jgi:hypothetical protein
VSYVVVSKRVGDWSEVEDVAQADTYQEALQEVLKASAGFSTMLPVTTAGWGPALALKHPLQGWTLYDGGTKVYHVAIIEADDDE